LEVLTAADPLKQNDIIGQSEDYAKHLRDALLSKRCGSRSIGTVEPFGRSSPGFFLFLGRRTADPAALGIGVIV
jgi:hypothetical protein